MPFLLSSIHPFATSNLVHQTCPPRKFVDTKYENNELLLSSRKLRLHGCNCSWKLWQNVSCQRQTYRENQRSFRSPLTMIILPNQRQRMTPESTAKLLLLVLSIFLDANTQELNLTEMDGALSFHLKRMIVGKSSANNFHRYVG